MAAAHRVLVTGVANPTHLLYIASYLRRLLASGGPVEVLTPPGGRVDLEAPENRALLPSHPALEVRVGAEWSCPDDADLTYVSVGAPGLKPYAALRHAHPRRRIPVVVTDEGLGTYGTWRTRRAAWAREGVPEPWRTARALAVAAGARALTSQRWALYAREGVAWKVVEEAAEEFRRRVPVRVPRGVHSRRVVLLSQPWVELGVLPEREYLDHVERLAAQVGRAGREFVVRAHPREPSGRYSAVGEVGREVPAELDPQVVHASAVLGGPSTALLNLAAVHGVPTVRIGVPGRPDLDDTVSPAQAALLEQFLGAAVDESHVPGRLALGDATR